MLLEKYPRERMVDGRRAGVNHGYLPEREILSDLGLVQVPKVRGRSGSGVIFHSALEPPYVRTSRTVAATIPWLYLHRVSSGHLAGSPSLLLGEDAKGLSPAVLGRLQAEWAKEQAQWQRRSLQGKRYAYWWVDGIYTDLRAEDDPRMCLLVIIGVTAAGKRGIVAVTDGLGESKSSWLEVLRDLRDHGRQEVPLQAIVDGALGFWSALDEIYPQTRHHRCWVHKTANILNALSKRLQGKAKTVLQAEPCEAAKLTLQALYANIKPSIRRLWRNYTRTGTYDSPLTTLRQSTGDLSAAAMP